jgi:hypothetical protein
VLVPRETPPPLQVELLHHVIHPIRDLEISEAFYTKTYRISGAVHEISGSGFKTSLSVQEPSI